MLLVIVTLRGANLLDLHSNRTHPDHCFLSVVGVRYKGRLFYIGRFCVFTFLAFGVQSFFIGTNLRLGYCSLTFLIHSLISSNDCDITPPNETIVIYRQSILQALKCTFLGFFSLNCVFLTLYNAHTRRFCMQKVLRYPRF